MTGIVNPKVERAGIIRGDARRIPLRDETVDLVCTSPPYFALRSYGAGAGEIGAETHWREWLAALVEATAEMVRVLKPEGSIFVNLGDKYANDSIPGNRDTIPAGGRPGQAPMPGHKSAKQVRRMKADHDGVPAKSLMLLPERYRIACVDQLGLICRAVIVWDKPNGLPESVRDRVRRSHEDWVHLVKQPRCYSALDELREPHLNTGGGRGNYQKSADRAAAAAGMPKHTQLAMTDGHPLGKLPGSVWTVPSEPLRLPPWLATDHYAAFPTEWPRRLILGWSPPGICAVCGQGRFPVVDKRLTNIWHDKPDDDSRYLGKHDQHKHNLYGVKETFGSTEATILGYACACCPHTDHPGTGKGQWAQDERTDGRLAGLRAEGASRRPAMNELHNYQRVGPWREWHLDRWTPPPTRPSVVLDPFGGTGTTAHVAYALGRIGVSVDLSEPYCQLAADQTLARQRGFKVHGRVHQERQGTLL